MSILYKPKSFYEALGIFVTICFNDKKIYQQIKTIDMARIFAPPIQLEQYGIWLTEEGKPFAFMTWALLTKEKEDFLLKENYLTPKSEDWKSGHNLWIMDFVCPFGNVGKLLYEARSKFFHNFSHAYAIRRNADGTIRKYSQFLNSHYEDHNKA